MTTFTGIVYYKDGKEVKKMSEKEMRTTVKNIEDLINTFENTGDNGNFFIGDYSNVEIAIYLKKQQEEIERLNNIIDELEKWLIKQQIEEGEYCDFLLENKQIKVEEVLDKLHELKGSDK